MLGGRGLGSLRAGRQVPSHPAERANGWSLVQGCATQDAAEDETQLVVYDDAASSKKRKATVPCSEGKKKQMAINRRRKKEELEQLRVANT